MEKQMIFYIAGVAGVVIHFLLKIRDASTKSEVFNWKKHTASSVWSILIVAVIVAFRLDLISLLSKVGIDLSDVADNRLVWFFFGYFADSAWKNIEKTGFTILKIQDPDKTNPPITPPADPEGGQP